MILRTVSGIGGIREATPNDQGQEKRSQSIWDNIPPPPSSGKWEKVVLVKKEGNTLTIQISPYITGKILDEQEIQVIGRELFHLSDELAKEENHRDGKPLTLRLDFSNLIYVSTTVLGKFITLNKKQADSGSKFELANIDPEIYEVFEITKLNKLFTIIDHPTEPKHTPRWGSGSGQGNLY